MPHSASVIAPAPSSRLIPPKISLNLIIKKSRSMSMSRKLLGLGVDAGLEGQVGGVLVEDCHFHALAGVARLEVDDVVVAQTDAALAGAPRHARLIVGAAVDAYSAVSRSDQAHKPVAIGLDVATAVLEVVLPRRCILYLADAKRLASGARWRFHVAPALFLAFVLAQAHGILGKQQGVALGGAIDIKARVLLADNDKLAALVHFGGSVVVTGLVGRFPHEILVDDLRAGRESQAR